VLTILPGMLVIWFATTWPRALPWAGCEEGDDGMDGLDLADGAVLLAIGLMLMGMTLWNCAPSMERRGFLPIATTRGDRCSSAFWQRLPASAGGRRQRLAIWVASLLSLAWLVVVLRWG
jgi:predicted small integral membrane protein